MRIISNYKDYYDSLQDYSDSTIWNRQYSFITDNEEGLNKVWKKLDIFSYYDKKYNKDSYTHILPLILGFCGQYYKYIIRIESLSSNSLQFDDELFNPNSKNSYNLLDVSKENNIRKIFSSSFFDLDVSFLLSENLFTRYNSPVILFVPLFFKDELRKQSSSIFHIIINPSLKKLGFSKKKDIQQVYQELDMFVSGVLTNKEDRPELSEKHRQGARFDKYSFRRLPEK